MGEFCLVGRLKVGPVVWLEIFIFSNLPTPPDPIYNKDKTVSDTPETIQTTQDVKAAVGTDVVTLQTSLNNMNTLSMDMKCMNNRISEFKEDIKELKNIHGKVEEIKIIFDNALEDR